MTGNKQENTFLYVAKRVWLRVLVVVVLAALSLVWSAGPTEAQGNSAEHRQGQSVRNDESPALRDITMRGSGRGDEAMGNNLGPKVRGARRLAALGLSLLLGLVLMGGLTASTASATSNVAIVRQTMEGALEIKPGAWVAAGYVLRIKNTHPAMTVRVKQAQVVVNFRCENSGKPGQIIIPLHPVQAYVDYPIAANDTAWRPTKDTNEADGYQGAGRAPTALCAPREDLISDGAAGGVNFTAEVKATNLTSDIEIKFHYRVPAAKGFSNINCGNESQNPSPGIPACTAKWSPGQTLRATETLTDRGDDAGRPPQVDGFVFNASTATGCSSKAHAAPPLSRPSAASRLKCTTPTPTRWSGRCRLVPPSARVTSTWATITSCCMSRAPARTLWKRCSRRAIR